VSPVKGHSQQGGGTQPQISPENFSDLLLSIEKQSEVGFVSISTFQFIHLIYSDLAFLSLDCPFKGSLFPQLQAVKKHGRRCLYKALKIAS